MFPITTFDGGHRSCLDDSAREIIDTQPRHPERSAAESKDEAREALPVLSWTETIEWARSDNEIILHS